MAKQNKAYKFRLYPTNEQAFAIRKTFGCVRFVYNKMLGERKETYETLKAKGSRLFGFGKCTVKLREGL